MSKTRVSHLALPSKLPTRLRSASWILEPTLAGLACAASVAFVGAFLWIALRRIAYPFDLEWLEGAMVDHARWILAGHPLYGPPSLEFTPFVYMPLFSWVSAVLLKLFGAGYAPLRALSMASALACFSALYLLVRHETGSRALGLLSAGVFAATFKITGAWFDLVRVDSLFLALLFWGVYRARVSTTLAGIVGAGVLLSLSFFTKQTALIPAMSTVIGTCFRSRRLGIQLGAVFLGLSGLAYLALDIATHGWLFYYTYEICFNTTPHRESYWGFWQSDLLGSFFFILPLVFAYFLLARRQVRVGSLGFYACLGLGCIACSYVMRLNPGGFHNVLLPAFGAIAVLAGLGSRGLARGTRPGLAGVLVYALWSLQFFSLRYDIEQQIPTAADRLRGERFVQQVRAIPGDVWIPCSGFIPSLAGKRTFAHLDTLYESLRAAPGNPGRERVEQEMKAWFSRRPWSAVITDERLYTPFLEEFYTAGDPALAENLGSLAPPRTGANYHPRQVLRPR